MKHFLTLLLLISVSLVLGACSCKTCHVGSPGGCCEPCAAKPKALKRPRDKVHSQLPRWPERPVRCVTTTVCRKCCHCETACTKDGYSYEIEVCEITYKSLYTDGSSKIWTEVSRNPVSKSPSNHGNVLGSGSKFQNRTWRSKGPRPGSIVAGRCDRCGPWSKKCNHVPAG